MLKTLFFVTIYNVALNHQIPIFTILHPFKNQTISETQTDAMKHFILHRNIVFSAFLRISRSSLDVHWEGQTQVSDYTASAKTWQPPNEAIPCYCLRVIQLPMVS